MAEPPVTSTEDFEGSDQELAAEIDRLDALNGSEPDREAQRRLLRLRHLMGLRRLDSAAPSPAHPEPDFDGLPEGDPLPEFTPSDLTPELLRAGILRDGCVLVRGMVDRDTALGFADEIERLFDERERVIDQGGRPNGYYEEFVPRAPHAISDDMRGWIRAGGGVLAADSSRLNAAMLEMFADVRLPELVASYLGEEPLISLEKTTLRKADPSVTGAWHQDGKFMGDVRALNLWLSLSRCGDESPGLDLVPRRLDHIVEAGTEGAFLDIQVSQQMAEEAAGDKPIIRPIFEPGDALLFDDLFLHSTASEPSMPKPRYAIENWFFGASAFPSDYGPLAV